MTQWHAATNGSPTGDGTVSKPWDLGTAFTALTQIKPGDSILMRGGRYNFDLVSRWEIRFSGIASARITIRSFPGELAILDTQLPPPSPDVGWLRIYGSYLDLVDFRVTCSSLRPRTTNVGGSAPWAVNPIPGQPKDPLAFHGNMFLDAGAKGVRFINLLTDNLVQGPDHQQSIGGGVYGCINSHHGWQGPDRAHGHGIYAQNSLEAPDDKLLNDNVNILNYSHGGHFYGTKARVDFMKIEGNVYGFNRERDVLFGGAVPSQKLTISNNYGPPGVEVMVGYTDGTFITPNVDGSFSNNVFPDANLTIGSWQNLQQGNNILGPIPASRAVVRPNQFETGRAHVIIWTKNNESSFPVDLSSVLAPGKRYEIRRAWQLYGPPLVSGTYSGPVSIPMAASTADAPIGSGEQPRQMPANFGIFLVRSPDGQALPPPTDPPPPVPPVQITEPADGTTLVIGQTYQFTGAGESLVWKLDVMGASNPAPITGPTFAYKIPAGETPAGVTKIVATLTGAGGSVSRTYSVKASVIPPPSVVEITSPADGAPLQIGQTVVATGTGSNLSWMVDISGAANPPVQTGPSITFVVPPNTTKVVIKLTGSEGTDTNTHLIGVAPPVNQYRAVFVGADGKLYAQQPDGTYKELKLQ